MCSLQFRYKKQSGAVIKRSGIGILLGIYWDVISRHVASLGTVGRRTFLQSVM